MSLGLRAPKEIHGGSKYQGTSTKTHIHLSRNFIRYFSTLYPTSDPTGIHGVVDERFVGCLVEDATLFRHFHIVKHRVGALAFRRDAFTRSRHMHGYDSMDFEMGWCAYVSLLQPFPNDMQMQLQDLLCEERPCAYFQSGCESGVVIASVEAFDVFHDVTPSTEDCHVLLAKCCHLFDGLVRPLRSLERPLVIVVREHPESCTKEVLNASSIVLTGMYFLGYIPERNVLDVFCRQFS